MPTQKKLAKLRKTKRRVYKPKKGKMHGGSSDNIASKYASCTSADRHNLQTSEANLDLINGAGVIPTEQTGGADNGICTGNAKLLSFKDYTTNVAKLLGVNTAVTDLPSLQTGGGYSIDPSAEQIGGQPARVGYSDCCPPVSLEGKLFSGAHSGAVCGQQAGGAGSCGYTPSTNVSKKQSKSKMSKSRSYKKQQKGGDSVPAAYPSESHNGANGDFSDHGNQLHFDGRQPFWDATTR